MPIHPQTDTFAGIEKTGDRLSLRWISAAETDGVLETADQFRAQFDKMVSDGEPVPHEMRIADSALERHLSALKL